jgi:hypothetical protein
MDRAMTGWSLLRRLAFRFVFCYFVLYILVDPVVTTYIPVGRLGGLWRPLVLWVGTRVLHTRYDIGSPGLVGGVNNSAYGLILGLCFL